MNSKLRFEVLKRVKFVRGIKVFIVLTMWRFDFTVMVGRERTDQLVFNLSLFERALKERKIVGRRADKAFRELKTVVRFGWWCGLRDFSRRASSVPSYLFSYRQMYCRFVLYLIAAFVTPYFCEYFKRDWRNLISCVTLFMAIASLICCFFGVVA